MVNYITQRIDSPFELKVFIRDSLKLFLSQILILLIGLVQVFIIPKKLSTYDYGYWQLFSLYGVYIGLLHLGFSNGVKIRWAGKKLTDIGAELKIGSQFLLFEQIIIVIATSFVLYYFLHGIDKWLALLILFSAIISNLISFFNIASQSVKNFSLSAILASISQIFFLFFVIIMLTLGDLSYMHLILFSILSSMITLLFFISHYRLHLFDGKKNDPKLILRFGINNIQGGFLFLIGNFIALLLTSLDKLMVSSFYSVEIFATYSFAVSITSMATLFMQAISQVFFPHLSGSASGFYSRAYQWTKFSILFAWGGGLLISFLVINIIINLYLPKYTSSIPIIKIMLCTLGISGLIQILQYNFFMLYRKQTQYFLIGLFILSFEAISIYFVHRLYNSLTIIAMAALVGTIIWYLLNELSLMNPIKESNSDFWRSNIAIISYIGLFWISSTLIDGYIYQMLFSLGCFILVTYIIYNMQIKLILTYLNFNVNWFSRSLRK